MLCWPAVGVHLRASTNGSSVKQILGKNRFYGRLSHRHPDIMEICTWDTVESQNICAYANSLHRSPQVHKLRLRCRLDAASVLVIHTLNTVGSKGSWGILMNEYILV